MPPAASFLGKKLGKNLSNKLVKGCSRLDNLHRVDFNRSPTAIVLQVKLEIINSRGWDS